MWHCSKAHHKPSLIIASTTSAVAHAQAFAHARQQVGRVAHGLHAAGYCNLYVACADALVGEHYRLQSRSAHLVDGERGDLLRKSAVERGLARRILPRPALTTLPMMHSSTIAGSIPARRTASATTSAPSCGAVNSLSAPRNLPVGVRTAETMTEWGINGAGCWVLSAKCWARSATASRFLPQSG